MNMIKVESLNKSIKGKAILKGISFEEAALDFSTYLLLHSVSCLF